MIENKITFEKILPTEQQIKLLFDLLTTRKHVISHKVMPNFAAHQDFVRSNPYVVWYLVFMQDDCLGSYYINHDNTLGIHIIDGQLAACLGQILQFTKDNHQPLPAIKSVRGASFAINVAPSNQEFMGLLDNYGLEILQMTYSLH